MEMERERAHLLNEMHSAYAKSAVLNGCHSSRANYSIDEKKKIVCTSQLGLRLAGELSIYCQRNGESRV